MGEAYLCRAPKKLKPPETALIMKQELIWQNASPGSAFLEGWLPIDLSKYYAVIVYGYGNSSSQCAIGNVGHMLHMEFLDSGEYIVRRAFRSAATGIQFYNCGLWGLKVPSYNNNLYCVPTLIYGLWWY